VTHDELLALLKPMTNDDAIFMKDALRAVVELHSPVGVVCGWCTCHRHDHIVEYPCKTIRVIEKGLE
jgi:hypothetical protein